MYNAGEQAIEGAELEPQPISISPDLSEVRSHPLFNDLDDALADELLRSCTAVQYRAGSTIVRQGGPIAGLQVVHRGLVDLAHIDGDHEYGVLLLATKDLLLPGTTLFDESSLVSARALTTTKIVNFEQAAVRSAMASSSALATNILKAMSGQWRMAVRSILDLNCRTAAQRLASFLLRLADLQSDSAAPSLPIAKRHLAARLGMTAETLSRMLQVVAQNGLYLRGRTIIVHDRQRILDFCGPDPYPSRDDSALNVFAL
jgi:CRP-like cAMP-binding protein